MKTSNAIEVKNISKTFSLPHEKTTSLKGAFLNAVHLQRGRTIEKQTVLKNISLEVKEGEFLGVVGRNGSGKSTLLKILAGIYQPSSGNVKVKGRLVPFIELGVGFNGELSGRDNVYLNGALFGFSKAEMDRMYESIVKFAELEKFMDQKLKNYSSGMQVRLAFSIAIRAEADTLLIDEVLAVGDEAFQRKCFDYFKDLKANKKTVVFVTHDMEAVREYCDRAILLEEKKVLLSGLPSEVARAYSNLFKITKSPPVSIKTRRKPVERKGNGALRVVHVVASIQDSHLTVKAKLSVYEDISTVIYGLHVIDQNDEEVTAMNNRMIAARDIKHAKRGSVIELKWKMQNVFSNGRYTITLTFIDDAQMELDWVNNAAAFTVRKRDKSTTSVLPPVTVAYTMR